MPHIRPAEARDADAIAELLEQLGYPAPRAGVQDRLRRMAADPGAAVLVAEVESVVCALATYHAVPVLHEDPPRGQLTGLVVSEAHRRRGIGEALVAHVERLAAGQGVTGIVVTTANHRAEAHAFYERLGYAWTGRRYAKQLDV